MIYFNFHIVGCVTVSSGHLLSRKKWLVIYLNSRRFVKLVALLSELHPDLALLWAERKDFKLSSHTTSAGKHDLSASDRNVKCYLGYTWKLICPSLQSCGQFFHCLL